MDKNKIQLLSTQGGFSLIEIIVVVVIVAVAASIAAPNIMAWGPNLRLKSGARDLFSAMQRAKLEAAKENKTVVIEFSPVLCMAAPVTAVPAPGVWSYRLFIDDGGGLVGNANNFDLDAGEQILATSIMPNNVALCNGNGHTVNFAVNTAGNPAAGFTPQGIPAGGVLGGADIVNDEDNSYRVTLSSAGVIRLQ